MKILITGNMGYIGPTVVRQLRESHPEAILVGLDMGYFASCLTASDALPECQLDAQYFCDVRKVSPSMVTGVDVVVYLAAISNDPMGATFEGITFDVNHHAAIRLATNAKKAGAKAFVFASSCSVYGFAEGGPRREEDSINPLTAYAKSKVSAERDLAQIADKTFQVTCLRFATACGMSERLRLDLVLNDFVASAVALGKITILSDGTPWRPLIHIKDMARAIDWGVQRDGDIGSHYIAVNVGSDQWNYRIKDLAEAVKSILPNCEIDINTNAQSDKRSYRVSFERFTQLAPNFLPQIDLITAIRDLRAGLETMRFQDADFRKSKLIRLNMLKHLRQTGQITDELEWIQHRRRFVAV